MTGFGDVNVGDKVRLTHRDGFTEARGRVGDLSEATTPRRFWLEVLGWVSEDVWSVKVLEPAPKPLPKEPGLYFRAGVAATNPTLWSLERHGGWITDSSGEWEKTAVDDVPADLVRLVPESAVEEARTKVVKEIVNQVRYHTSQYVSHKALADGIERSFGGKA